MVCMCDLLTPQRVLDDDNIDVFEQIVDNTEFMYAEKRRALWSTYRYRFLGSCDVQVWIQVMRDRYIMISREYDLKMVAFGMMYDQVGDEGPDLSAGSSESQVITENEDTPDTADNSTRYLSNRTTVKAGGRVFEGLQTTTYRDWINGVARDPIRDFTREFDDLFVYC